MKIIKPIKDNATAITIIIIVAIGIVFVVGSGMFSIISGSEKSYYVGDMISGTIGLTGGANGPSDSNGKYSIEIKQVDGSYREAWTDEYTRDLRITFTNSYPNACGDVYKDYGSNIACDSDGTWGYRPKIRQKYPDPSTVYYTTCPLQNYVEPGCYSYIPRLRQTYPYYGRVAEGIAIDFTANDVQEDGNIVYKTVITSSTSGGSFGVAVSGVWDLVPNPNPKECSNLEYDADIVNKKFRQCDADGYWTPYTVCNENQNLIVTKGVYSCELIPEPVIDDTPTTPPTTPPTGVVGSFDFKSYYDFTNNPLKAWITTGSIVLVIVLAIIFLPTKGGKKK